MQATAVPSAGLRTALAGASGAASRAGSIGTEHLLLVLVARGPAGRIVDEFGITAVSVAEIVRQAAWTASDEAGPDDDTGPLGEQAWFGGKQRKPLTFTGAARAALHRAIAAATADGRAEFGPDDLLDAVLAAPNRAGEALTRSGADPQRVRDRLAGGPPPERVAIDPDLEPTRDAVLGTAPYTVGSFTGRMAYGFLRAVNANLARTPAPWADLDARDQARRLGHRKVRTAHLLLAMLAVHEVTRDLPYLITDAADRYGGIRALAGTGLTYATVRAALAAEPPGRDPRRYRSYVDGQRDTAAMLAGVLSGDTSASRLLAALGVEKPEIS